MSLEQAAGPDKWAVINFVLLTGALVFILRKPLSERFRGKRASVSRAVDEAEELSKSAEAMSAEYGGKLSRMESEVSQIIGEARAAGEREKLEILERARKMAERIAEDGKLAAEKERLRILGGLEKEILSEAVRRAEHLLRERVTEKEHRMFTNELIATLEEGPDAGR